VRIFIDHGGVVFIFTDNLAKEIF